MPGVLVAHDLTERSDTALARGAALAAQLNEPVRLVSAVDDELPAALVAGRVAEAEDWLRAALKKAGLDATATVAAIPGRAEEVIPTEAHRMGASLIVFGRHRPRAWFDGLRSTTLDRVLRQTRIPAIIATNPTVRPYASVILGNGLSSACAAAARTAARLAPGAKMHAVHAIHLPYVGLTGELPTGPMAEALRSEAGLEATAWAERESLPPGLPPTEMVIGGVGWVLAEAAKQHGADLVALGAHTRSGPAAFAFGSTAADLLREAPCDLLLARSRPPQALTT
jgi:nucleotide-binding universal stress UspA family protein